MSSHGAQSSPDSSQRGSQRIGKGATTILCFHHAGDSVLSPARLASALPAGWDAAAVSLPGHEGPGSGRAPRRPKEIAGRIAQEFAAMFGGRSNGRSTAFRGRILRQNRRIGSGCKGPSPIDFPSLDAGHFPWATAADEFGTLLAKAPKAERISGACYIALENIKPVSDDPE